MYSETHLVKFWGHVIGYDMSKISEKRCAASSTASQITPTRYHRLHTP